MMLTNKASGESLLSGEGAVSSSRQAAGLSSAVDMAELCLWVMLPPVPLLPLLCLLVPFCPTRLLLLPSPVKFVISVQVLSMIAAKSWSCLTAKSRRKLLRLMGFFFLYRSFYLQMGPSFEI